MKKLLYAVVALLILAQPVLAIPPGGGGGGAAISDAAGNGDTALVWSADKVYDQLALKQTADANLTALSIANLATPGANSLVGHTSAGAFANYTSVDLGLTTNYMWIGTASKAAEVATTGTGSVVRSAGAAITPAEVDGHVTSTDLTAAQVSNTVIHNYDQAASDVFLIAPAAAAGYSALFTVVTAQANHWGFEAAENDKIYLIAADGTVAAGDDGAAVVMTAAQLGQSFACWTFKSGASSYDWMCKAISIGTSTFAAHASSE